MTKKIVSLIILLVLIVGRSLGEDKITIAILDLEAGGVSSAEAVSITNRIRNELFLTGRYKDVVNLYLDIRFDF